MLAILVDLDHTIFDFDASENAAFADLAAWAGIGDVDAGFATYAELNRALWRRVESGDVLAEQVRTMRSEQLIEALDLDVDVQEMSDRFIHGLGAHGDLYPGASEVLDELATLGELAMVTNGVGTVQRAKIERLGLDRWFAGYAISGELGIAKPDPSIFAHALASLGRDLADVSAPVPVMIGDGLRSDIAGAVAAGLRSCWFNSRGEQRSSADPVPTWEIASLRELPPIVGAAR